MDMMCFYCKRGLGLNFRYSILATLKVFFNCQDATNFILIFDVFFVDSFHRLFALARCFGKTPSSKGSRLSCGAAQPCPSRSGEPNTIAIPRSPTSVFEGGLTNHHL